MRKINILTDEKSTIPALVAVCDDEAEQLEELQQVLETCGKREQFAVEAYISAEQLLESIRQKTAQDQLLPDIIFLDIVMDEKDGIVLGKELRKLAPDSYLIFITAHPEYAIKGYEAQAFRYILKPLTGEKVQEVLAEVRKDCNQKQKFLVKSMDNEYIVDLRDIYYLNAEDKYTLIHTADGYYMDSTSLAEYEEILSAHGFYRIHRKYLVNTAHHKKINKKMVVLDNSVELPLSRRREKEYRETLLYGYKGEK